MKKLIASLKNKHGLYIAKIYQYSDVDFELVTCYDEYLECEEQHFAEFWIKWDGCSHWTFNGERHVYGEEGCFDGYYHICGWDSYIQHFTYMSFAFKTFIMKGFIEDKSEIEDYEKHEYILKDYIIEIVEED